MRLTKLWSADPNGRARDGRQLTAKTTPSLPTQRLRTAACRGDVPPADVARGSAARGVDEGLPNTRIFGGASVLTLELTSLASRPVEYCAAMPVVCGHSSITTRRSAHPQNCSEERTGGVFSRSALLCGVEACAHQRVALVPRRGRDRFHAEFRDRDLPDGHAAARLDRHDAPIRRAAPHVLAHLHHARDLRGTRVASDAAGRAAGRGGGRAQRTGRLAGREPRFVPSLAHHTSAWRRWLSKAIQTVSLRRGAAHDQRSGDRCDARTRRGARSGRARFGDIAHAAHLPRPKGGHLRALRARRRVLQPPSRRPLRRRQKNTRRVRERAPPERGGGVVAETRRRALPERGGGGGGRLAVCSRSWVLARRFSMLMDAGSFHRDFFGMSLLRSPTADR